MIEDLRNLFQTLYAKIKGDVHEGRISSGQIEKTILLFGLFPYIMIPISLFVIFKGIQDGSLA